MWRAFFIAMGITFAVLGAECLMIDEAVVVQSAVRQPQRQFLGAPAGGPARRVIHPPEWAPWTLLSAGVVVLLYSFTIPQRMSA